MTKTIYWARIVNIICVFFLALNLALAIQQVYNLESFDIEELKFILYLFLGINGLVTVILIATNTILRHVVLQLQKHNQRQKALLHRAARIIET